MATVEVERVPLDQFAQNFSTAIELSSVALGGTISSVSDEFFAEAYHLLFVEPAPSLKGQFGPKGALFSGWETRRHNPTYDWCIIKLGTTGSIFGFDIDTAHFNGNEAPQVSVDALFSPDGNSPTLNDAQWTEILPKVNLGPNSRHLFKIPPSSSVNYVKLNMYPDGGIARFRVYGLVIPVLPLGDKSLYDLAHVFAGGLVVLTSDQHFGVGSNLILPGRGKDMGDGWETKRSRQPGHKDWVIIKLGNAGYLSYAEIDTAHFKGNFPESCEIHACTSSALVPAAIAPDQWTLILPRTKLGPHRQHEFQLINVDKPFTHILLTIYPDGGIKRVRLFGCRAAPAEATKLSDVHGSASLNQTSDPSRDTSSSVSPSPVTQASLPHSAPVTPALALTSETFAPFGQVVQAYSDINATPTPRETLITGANQGTAVKFHKLSILESSYPPETGATAGLSVYRCKPIALDSDGKWAVKLLERHPYTNQAFIPMGVGRGTEQGLTSTGTRYLVIVAKNGEDDQPDLKSMRAFIASTSQGIVYNTGIWHHPMAVLDEPIDFTCVETQIGNGDKLDCEIVELTGQLEQYEVKVPVATS